MNHQAPFLLVHNSESSFADLLLVTEKTGGSKTVVTFQIKNVASKELSQSEVGDEAAKVVLLLQLLASDEKAKAVKHRHLFVMVAKRIHRSVILGKVQECVVVDQQTNVEWKIDVLVLEHYSVLGEFAIELAKASLKH